MGDAGSMPDRLLAFMKADTAGGNVTICLRGMFFRYNSRINQRSLRGNERDMDVIRNAKDNCLKLILGEHELFSEFLRDFINIDILKAVDTADIEDITERFIPLFMDQKDSDVVKRINLKGDAPFLVISIVEHESEVNYRSSFKMLQYIALVLNDYEKEINAAKDKNKLHERLQIPTGAADSVLRRRRKMDC